MNNEKAFADLIDYLRANPLEPYLEVGVDYCHDGVIWRVIVRERIKGAWHIALEEILFTCEPEWSNNTGAIPASSATHVYSVLHRVKAKIEEIKERRNA